MDMRQLAFLAGASFLTGFSGALPPGPMFVATVMESTRSGGKAGPLIVLGHVVAELSAITALAIGLSLVMELPTTRIVVGLIGGLFLLVSAFDLFRTAKRASLNGKSGGGEPVMLKYGPVAAGVLTSLSNPYFFIWWATTGNRFVLEAISVGGSLGVVVFALAHWMSDLSWFTAVSMSIHKGRRVFSDRVYRTILFLCGLFLVYLGVDFIAGSLNIFISR